MLAVYPLSEKKGLDEVSLKSLFLDPDHLSIDSLTLVADSLQTVAHDFWAIRLQTPSGSAVFSLCLAIILLGASAMISASEVAFFSLTPDDHSRVEDEEHPSDNIISRLLHKSERLMATILIGNNLVNVAIIMLFTHFMNATIAEISPTLSFLLQTVILTFLLLLFGEIMPKVYASHSALPFARRMAGSLQVMQTIFAPFVNILVHSTGAIHRHFTARMSGNVSSDDLSDALKLTKQVAKDEKRLLEHIIQFGDKTVKDAMTSRMDMTTLSIDTPFSEVLKLVVDTNYSRIPVYEDTEDHIKGILYNKDLLPYLNKSDGFRWQDLVREAYFVPESKMIADLLDDFRRKHLHMAIVVDEFGGTTGLITMEDVLEEIVGEIRDEYDEEERTWQKLGRNEWMFEARTALNDFYKVTGVSPDEFSDKTDNCESIAGLILELKQEFPKVHESVSYGRCRFTVLAMERRRIERVKVLLLSRE